jgi:hypothetical protein
MRGRAINAIGAAFALVSGVTVVVAATSPAIADGCTAAPVAADDTISLYPDNNRSYMINSLVLPNDNGNGATPTVDSVTAPDTDFAEAWAKRGNFHLKLYGDTMGSVVTTTYDDATACGTSNFATVTTNSLVIHGARAHKKPGRKVEFVNKDDKRMIVKMWNAYYGFPVKPDKVFKVAAHGSKTVRRFHHLENWTSKLVVNFPGHPTVPQSGGDIFCGPCRHKGHG